MYLYFTGTGIIFQVNICQRIEWSDTSHAHLTSGNDIFYDIQIFITLYRSLQFKAIGSDRRE